MIVRMLILMSLLVSVACSSKQEEKSPDIVAPELRTSVVGGTDIHLKDEEKLRYKESVKAYSLGRYIDPSDSSIMHEEGIVYRVENDSSWNLQPGLTPNLPFSEPKTVSVKDNEKALRAEIEVKANEQRALYRYLKTAADKASGQIDLVKESAVVGRKLLEQNKLLKEKLISSEKKKLKLNEELLSLKKQVAVLLKFYQQKQAESTGSRFRRK